MPRSRSHVHSVKKELDQTSKPEDDLALVIAESFVHPAHYPDTRVVDGNLYVISRLPEMDAHISALIRQKQKLVFGYDTTFKCGEFWTSILIFRHPYLEDHRVVPCAFLFHSTKEEVAHNGLFREVVKRVPAMNSDQVTIITDRELGIKNAIRQALPKAFHIFCYKHMADV